MTSNPMFRENVTENIVLDSKPMTVQGAVNKSFLLLAIVIASSVYTWNLMTQGFNDKAAIIMAISSIAGFILALITCFKPHLAKITGSAYALCEGLLVGAVSYQYQAMYNGIVVQAVGITFAIMFSMLFLYKIKAIQATENFRRIIITATMGILIYYIVCIVASLLGHPVTVFNGGMVGIGISLFICAIAAFNFILDFDFIEKGSQNMLPDYFEWYGAFGLLVTSIWLYFEMLRLLAQLNSRK